MKFKNDINKDLQILWEMRDRAQEGAARKQAQANIDDYFLGKGKKHKKRKEKKKKFRMPTDEWSY